MYLHALQTVVPDHSLTQEELWNLIQNLPQVVQLRDGSRQLLERVLRRSSGIRKRHFASGAIPELFAEGAEGLNRRFEEHGPALASRALDAACQQAGLNPQDLDACILCTCTGYLCPGLSSYVAEKAGCRPDCELIDLVGLGCGAAIPMLRQAEAMIGAYSTKTVACLAVEICSDAFFLSDDAGVLISAALFSDGAAATIWGGTAKPFANGHAVRAHEFRCLHVPGEREKLRFRNDGGKLRNLLHPAVPQVAAQGVESLVPPGCVAGADMLLVHPGGPKVLEAIGLRYPGQSLEVSRAVLREFGNMSSPSILFCLQQALDRHPETSCWQLCSFGAGFSAHACRVTLEDAGVVSAE